MSHARTLTLDRAVDPIHAAIARHRAAYEAFQTAPEGEAALFANDDYDAATDALVATACSTRFGALALLDHLRWWLTEEAEFAAGHQPSYRVAFARAADLTLFFGTRLPLVAIPQAMPCGRLAPTVPHRLLPGVDRYRQNAPSALANEPVPGEIEPWEAVAPVRPDTANARALRVMDAAGALLAAVAIIAGGMLLTGLATLI